MLCEQLLSRAEQALTGYTQDEKLPLLWRGEELNASDVASSTGFLPIFFHSVKKQLDMYRQVLSPSEFYHFFWWVDNFRVTSDPNTLTGKALVCQGENKHPGLHYTFFSALYLEMKRKFAECRTENGLEFDRIVGEVQDEPEFTPA